MNKTGRKRYKHSRTPKSLGKFVVINYVYVLYYTLVFYRDFVRIYIMRVSRQNFVKSSRIFLQCEKAQFQMRIVMLVDKQV